MADYKLSDYRFLDKLVYNTEVYVVIKLKEIVIVMIKWEILKRPTIHLFNYLFIYSIYTT